MKKTSILASMAKASIFSIVLILLVSSLAFAEYSFTVHNTSGNDITQILVSEDGSEWGEFDIGSGIKAGATAELVWDESTDNEDCVQFFKAVFSDGSESEAAKFDFCEAGLTLEF
jgi:hypothetical protein